MTFSVIYMVSISAVDQWTTQVIENHCRSCELASSAINFIKITYSPKLYIVFNFTVCWCYFDIGLYTLFGIEKDADAAAIRSAYRGLALRHHPDRGGDPEKVAIFLL